MLKWCSYCQQFLGEVPDYDNFSISHGTCLECYADLLEQGDVDLTRPLLLKAVQRKLWTAGLENNLTAAAKVIRCRRAAHAVATTDCASSALQNATGETVEIDLQPAGADQDLPQAEEGNGQPHPSGEHEKPRRAPNPRIDGFSACTGGVTRDERLPSVALNGSLALRRSPDPFVFFARASDQDPGRQAAGCRQRRPRLFPDHARGVQSRGHRLHHAAATPVRFRLAGIMK